MWEGVALTLNACGPLCEYRETLEMLAGQRSQRIYTLHTAAVGWPLLWAVQLATSAQLEAEAMVRKLEEELKLEK